MYCSHLQQGQRVLVDTGTSLRSLWKRARPQILPGLHDPEEEIVRMIAFLVTFGLAALIVVGGVRASLRLRVPTMPTGRRLSGLRRSYSAPLRRSYATPMDYTT